MTDLPYLTAYPTELQEQARVILGQRRVSEYLGQHYPEGHQVRSNKELGTYVQDLKARHMRKAAPLGKVLYDNRLLAAHEALGLHVTRTRVQGTRLKKSRELRIASLFKEVPADFLRMIVVHELAHMKHADHDRDFYKLCHYMEPEYGQIEFDLRLHLTDLEWDRSGA